MPKKKLPKPVLKPKPKEASDPTGGSMNVPNHVLFCDLQAPEWIIKLQKNSGGLPPEGLVFVDDQHGCVQWQDRSIGEGDPPPTWMDPIVFIQLIRDDPRLVEVVKQYYRRKSSGSMADLCELLGELLETKYAPYLWEQFTNHIGYIAEFVVAAISSDLANLPKAQLKPRPVLKPKPTLLKPRPGA